LGVGNVAPISMIAAPAPSCDTSGSHQKRTWRNASSKALRRSMPHLWYFAGSSSTLVSLDTYRL